MNIEDIIDILIISFEHKNVVADLFFPCFY